MSWFKNEVKQRIDSIDKKVASISETIHGSFRFGSTYKDEGISDFIGKLARRISSIEIKMMLMEIKVLDQTEKTHEIPVNGNMSLERVSAVMIEKGYCYTGKKIKSRGTLTGAVMVWVFEKHNAAKENSNAQQV